MIIDPRIIYVGIGPASYMEIVWTAVAAVCVLISTVELTDSIKDLRALKRIADFVPGRQRHIVAKSNIRSRIRDIVFYSGLAWIGVIAMLSYPTTQNTPSSYAVAVPLFFIAIELFFAAVLILERRDRIALVRIIREKNAALDTKVQE
jgi:hypothetical protein